MTLEEISERKHCGLLAAFSVENFLLVSFIQCECMDDKQMQPDI